MPFVTIRGVLKHTKRKVAVGRPAGPARPRRAKRPAAERGEGDAAGSDSVAAGSEGEARAAESGAAESGAAESDAAESDAAERERTAVSLAGMRAGVREILRAYPITRFRQLKTPGRMTAYECWVFLARVLGEAPLPPVATVRGAPLGAWMSQVHSIAQRQGDRSPLLNVDRVLD